MAFVEFLGTKVLRPSTEKTYWEEFRGIYEPEFGARVVKEITFADMQRFMKKITRRYLKQRKEWIELAARTRRRHLTQLRSFFTWAKRMRYAAEDPTEGLKVEAGESREGQFIDFDQARELITRGFGPRSSSRSIPD